MSRWSILVACGLVLRPGSAAAQPDSLDDDRAMAKARFAADQATLAELTQQRVKGLKAAWDEYREMTGPPPLYSIGPPPPVREHSIPLLQAELALRREDDLGRLLELAWRIALQLDETEHASYLAGRATLADAVAARGNRLAAELDLLRLPERKPGPPEVGDPLMSKWNPAATFALAALTGGYLPETANAQTDALDQERMLAKARFAVDQAMPADLARQRVKAARDIYVQMNARYDARKLPPNSH